MRLKHFFSKFILATAGTALLLSTQPALAQQPQTVLNRQHHSGIVGVALLWPSTAFCNTGDESNCSPQPYPGAVINVKTSDGSRQIARLVTDQTGQFRIRLRPGVYLLDPEAGPSGLPKAQQVKVTVTKHNFTRIKISYDSDIGTTATIR